VDQAVRAVKLNFENSRNHRFVPATRNGISTTGGARATVPQSLNPRPSSGPATSARKRQGATCGDFQPVRIFLYSTHCSVFSNFFLLLDIAEIP
jgi:hypothetical protein